jgi:hypothetical protein
MVNFNSMRFAWAVFPWRWRVTTTAVKPGFTANWTATAIPLILTILCWTTVKLTSASGNVPGSVTLSQDLKSAVFSPSGLLSSFAVYTLVVDGAVEDAAGNKMGTAITSFFTTSDTEPPMVVSVSPANNAAGVAANAVIIVTFNEPIDTSNFNNRNLVVAREGAPAAGTIAFNESKMSVTFTPTGLRTDSLYSVTVQGAGDFAGNVQAAAFTSLFHTVDTAQP